MVRKHGSGGSAHILRNLSQIPPSAAAGTLAAQLLPTCPSVIGVVENPEKICQLIL
jgi:hypothetical protein